ncbi:pol protein [Cucumis melo var. makuwa]|uniref:Pol protein n=1 Tax=Cucumis melo var. makuwa TaxID=1194695 RepID=A0A5A7TZV5_CUCMM|nr:pol protein [Cucumis melo var. makuwa]
MGPELVQSTNEAIQKIRSRMHTAQSRQKSYTDVRLKDLEFEVGDKVFLKVAPMRGVLRFERRGKLSPRFVGPFEILERIDPVAYRLALPPSLSTVHDVFHVSMLRKYVPDPSHVVDYEPLEIDENLRYTEQPVEVLAREVKTLRNKEIPLVKVLWRNHLVEEATWEREDDMSKTGSHLSFLEGNRGLTLKFTVPRQVNLEIAFLSSSGSVARGLDRGHNQVLGKGFPTTGPRIEAGNVVINRGLHVTRLLVVACVPSGVRSCLRIDPDVGCSSLVWTLIMEFGRGRTVKVQRGADRREAGRMREGHMDASGFLYASADVDAAVEKVLAHHILQDHFMEGRLVSPATLGVVFVSPWSGSSTTLSRTDGEGGGGILDSVWSFGIIANTRDEGSLESLALVVLTFLDLEDSFSPCLLRFSGM